MSAPLTMRGRYDVPLRRVRDALTDARALRVWLAEHAEVDLPGSYAFWGRYTPEGDAPHQRPLYADERTLRFAWLLDGEDTTVEIDLAEDQTDATILSLTQTHVPAWPDVVAERGVRCVLATFWGLALANLADYLAGRELTPMCDFTSPRLRATVAIGAPPEEVYDSLVEPERFRRWFGVNMDIEPHVDGRWAMGGFDLENSVARIVELVPGSKVVLDWDGLVETWELAGSGGKTFFTFAQSGFDDENPPYAKWLGWLSGVAELRRFHELANWRPTVLQHDIPETPPEILVSHSQRSGPVAHGGTRGHEASQPCLHDGDHATTTKGQGT
jgi:uncharacterized protein YndB with AHSA1/START domain